VFVIKFIGTILVSLIILAIIVGAGFWIYGRIKAR
jgi:hypothetical protein